MIAKKNIVNIKSECGELRACRGCLATDVPLFDLSSQGLAQIFSELTGVPVLPTDSYPQHVCVMCKHLLSKFYGFRQRCHSAMYVIQQMSEFGIQVSTESLSSGDKSNLKINLITTDMQVISTVDSEEASTNHCDEILNDCPANAVNNIDLPNKDSVNNLYLIVDGTNDEKIDIRATIISDSVDNDNNVISILSESDECPSDSELQTKSKEVNKGNVTCKRPITVAEITDSVDNYNKVISVLSESDECPSDSELQTKLKRVKQENVTSKIPIKAAEIEDLVEGDNNVSSALSESDECPSDSELQTKLKRINKENVTSKRPIKAAEIEDLAEGDNNVSSALSESDEWPSDSELQTKSKRVNKENVTCKRPRETETAIEKETKGTIKITDEEQDVINTMSSIIRCAWREYCGSYVSLWEKVHQESLKDLHEPLDYEDFSEWTLTQKINQYLYLSKKLATLYNCELKFSCLADQKKEIEDRRSSEIYQNARFKCEYCCKHYSFEETYKRHMMSHDPKSGDEICEACLYRFKDRSQYTSHYFMYHTKMIVCKTCGAVNRQWREAGKHFKWHGGAAIACEHCKKHFANRKLYLMHRMNVHRVKFGTTPCLLCGNTFYGATGLRIHMQSAHRECARCPACDTRFASEDALAVHTAHSAQGCPTLSACPVCGHNFPSEPSMREHYDQLHKKEVECKQMRRRKACQKETNSVVWRRQRVTATGTRGRQSGTATISEPKQVYMCELCGQGNFTCYAKLRYHQRIHTGEKPYQCELCHKSFRYLQLLKEHIKTHTDTRPYKCPHCPKAFRQMPHRIAHIRTHTKERPYKCNICSKRYAYLPSLNEHIDTAHRGLPPRKRGKNKEKNCKNKL